jgi:hypothetical protein
MAAGEFGKSGNRQESDAGLNVLAKAPRRPARNEMRRAESLRSTASHPTGSSPGVRLSTISALTTTSEGDVGMPAVAYRGNCRKEMP